MNQNNNIITLILPKDMKILEDKYSEVLGDIIGDILTEEELKYLIKELEKK